MKEIRGKVAVITGGASGIGAALARLLAQAGCALALVDVQSETLERIAIETREMGARTSTHVVDVSDRSAMEALPAAVLAAHGAVHLVFNNAGVTVVRPFIKQSLDDWDWILGINLYGVVYGCHFFLPYLLEAGEGHLINISSVFGIAGVPFQSSYCTTKFAVRGLSETLWEELDGTGVQVTVVHPGGVRTNIIHGARESNQKRRERLARMFEQWAMPADRAAQIILDGVRREQKRIRIGREAYLIDWLRRLAPVAGNRLVTRFVQGVRR